MNATLAHLERGDAHRLVAERHLPGGASTSTRIYPMIGRPLYLERADGPYLFDLDGNQYIDYHNAAGASFLGHNHPGMKAAIQQSLDMGFFCHYDSVAHARLADLINALVPSAEMVRFCSSGSEATSAALRLSRAVTGRKRFLKFEGHYHGQQDWAFFNADSTLGRAGNDGEISVVHESAGVPDDLDALVTVIPWNDPEVFLATMRRHPGEFAAIMMEPVMFNAGCILPNRDFVQAVRDEATRDGAVLVFDEVLSGFRMAAGGGQEYLGITPDLTCLSKALGAGMPIAAIAGNKKVMAGLGPTGKTVVSTTYTGHLIAVMGAIAALEEIAKPDFYPKLNARADQLYSGINEILGRRGIKAVCQGLGGRFGIFFGIDETPIMHFRKVVEQFDPDMDKKFVRRAFERKLYFRDPGRRIVPIHHGFTAAHTEAVISETLDRLDDVFAGF
jgi:glutamate-1-semialdehyde 2,1-aminomutase